MTERGPRTGKYTVPVTPEEQLYIDFARDKITEEELYARLKELPAAVPLNKDGSLRTNVKRLSTPLIHGTVTAYVNHKCRCADCSKAQRDYWYERYGSASKRRK